MVFFTIIHNIPLTIIYSCVYIDFQEGLTMTRKALTKKQAMEQAQWWANNTGTCYAVIKVFGGFGTEYLHSAIPPDEIICTCEPIGKWVEGPEEASLCNQN